MELSKAKVENLTKNQIMDIKKYAHLIDIGSEISCYNLSSKQVIKFYDIFYDVSNNNKLYIPDNIYGNNTYVFIDAVQKYCDRIVSYTMRYVKGNRLGKSNTTDLFYSLTYTTILEYINTIISDSYAIANNGIHAFDCHENNIILTDKGFSHIDTVDFFTLDKDPSVIANNSIRLMCSTIWDSLINSQLYYLLKKFKLNELDFVNDPYNFIKELQDISQKYSDDEIITLNDTKKLKRTKF